MRIWIPLNPIMPLETVKGFGYAHFIIDQGQEHNIQWFVCINEGEFRGQFWILDNADVRACKNWTIRRGYADRLEER